MPTVDDATTIVVASSTTCGGINQGWTVAEFTACWKKQGATKKETRWRYIGKKRIRKSLSFVVRENCYGLSFLPRHDNGQSLFFSSSCYFLSTTTTINISASCMSLYRFEGGCYDECKKTAYISRTTEAIEQAIKIYTRRPFLKNTNG